RLQRRSRSAGGRLVDAGSVAPAGVQPDEPGSSGSGPGGAEGGEPPAEPATDPGGDGCGARTGLPLGQHGPDVRLARSDGELLCPYPGTGAGDEAGSADIAQLCAPAPAACLPASYRREPPAQS